MWASYGSCQVQNVKKCQRCHSKHNFDVYGQRSVVVTITETVGNILAAPTKYELSCKALSKVSHVSKYVADNFAYVELSSMFSPT